MSPSCAPPQSKALTCYDGSPQCLMGAVSRAVITRLGNRVSGQAKRRRLAQALAERPELLVQGHSPPPRGVGDLLIALRRAGPCASQTGGQGRGRIANLAIFRSRHLAPPRSDRFRAAG